MAKNKKTYNEIATGKPDKVKELTYSSRDECLEFQRAKILTHIMEIDFKDMYCNKAQWIESNLIQELQYFKETKSNNYNPINAEDLLKTFELLMQITSEINKKTAYCPTIMTFLKMLTISSSTFDRWLGEINEKGEAARQIQDYFKGLLAQGMLSGEYNPVAGSFIGKTTLGMRENDGNNLNVAIYAENMSVEEIIKEYDENQKSC